MFTTAFPLCISLLMVSQRTRNPDLFVPVHRIDHVASLWTTTYALAVTDDGRFFAASDLRNVVTIWDTKQQQAIRELPPNRGAIMALEFGKEGKTLFACFGYKDFQKDEGFTQIDVVDVFSGERRQTTMASGGILAISRWGNVVVTRLTYSWQRLLVTNLATGEKQKLLHESNVLLAAIDRAGKQLAAKTDDGVHIWDLTKSRIKTTIPPTYSAESLEFSPDGKQLAICANPGSRIRVFDSDSGKEVAGGFYGTGFGKFLNDGQCVACRSRKADGNIELWSLAPQRKYAILADVFPRGRSSIMRLAASADGSVIVGGRSNGQVIVWKLAQDTHPAATSK